MAMFDLTGKVAVVTGASSGLGADAARAYAEQGADVALLARRKDKLEALAGEITAMGRQALAVPCDVADESTVSAAIEAVVAKFGRIDILLNNAGIALTGSVDDMGNEVWDQMFDVNVRGLYLMSKYVVPHMKAQRYGRIINIGSVNAVVGNKVPSLTRHAYNASKAAVHGLTIGMATSLGVHGITVNTVAPGLFESEMTADTLFKADEFMARYNALCPLGRPAHRGELNGLIIYFSSDASSYTTGQVVYVDGGFSSV